MRLPFVRRAFFDGAPDPDRSLVVSGATINAPLDPRMFEPVASPVR